MVQGMTLIFLFGFPHPLLCDMAEPVKDISGLGTKARYSCKNGCVQIGTWICVCNSHNENGTHLDLIPFDCFIIFFPVLFYCAWGSTTNIQAQFHMNFSVCNWVTANFTNLQRTISFFKSDLSQFVIIFFFVDQFPFRSCFETYLE